MENPILSNSDHYRPREAFERSLKELDCEYIDLYLLHWPQASIRSGPTCPLHSPSILISPIDRRTARQL